ncbi:hypothetical protein N9059_00275 [bacterium]|nr:hypothetical protein [bacterium]
MKRFLSLLFVASLFLAGRVVADTSVLAKTVKGSPEIGQIDVLGFAPGGVLLIGDGSKQQVVAVNTGDVKKSGGKIKPVTGFKSELASRLGVKAGEVEIIDMVVNSASEKVYFAVRKQDDKSYVIVRIGSKGAMELVSLKNVEYAKVPLPKGEKAPVTKITDVAWAGGRLVAAARCNEEFASKIFATNGALSHGKKEQIYSAETYHVAHGRWETKAPMSTLIPYEEDGKHYIVGAFTCTPVVKYPLDDLKPGAKIKGISMIELGNGNRPLDMFAYEKGGKGSVLANTFRVHHKRHAFGPSPYWAARFDEDLLAGSKVNKEATRRLKGRTFELATDKIELVEDFHGVVQMDRLNKTHAVGLRQSGKDVDLVLVALP